MPSTPRNLSLLLPIALCLATSTAGAAQEPWTGFSGATSFEMNDAILRDLHIRVSGVEHPAGSAGPGLVGFPLRPSSELQVKSIAGNFKGFSQGWLEHSGGPVFELPDGTLSLRDFRLRVAGPEHDFELLDAAGARWFLLDHMHPVLSPDGRRLTIENVDLRLSEELAARLGRPDLVGLFLGTVRILLPAPPVEPVGDGGSGQGAGPCDDVFGPDPDVELIAMSGLSQGAREAGVRVAIAPGAKLRNVGATAVPWYRAIEPDSTPENIGPHPFLIMNFYRLAGGALEQIGGSDAKHGFFATNSNCICPSAQVLYPGCEDVYGTGTNLNRYFQAPREEITAFTGDWTRLGSHFDGTPVDDFRHHTGDEVHDDFEHRLVVAEPELQTPGASYFAEAWYLVAGDTDIFNSMGHRLVVPDLIDEVWSFALQDPNPIPGSILDEWVDPGSPPSGASNQLLDTGQGHLQLAVRSTNLGGGQHHYEYALMNFDFDAQIRGFSVPLAPGIQVSNAGFRGAHHDPAGAWQVLVDDTAITWLAPTGEELDWGTLYNFRFDADAPPQSSVTQLVVLEPAGGGPLTLGGVGPAAPPECSDGIDNDGDGQLDFPADSGCSAPLAASESPECNDGQENDSDGLIDFDGGAEASAGGSLCSGVGVPFDCCTGPGAGCSGAPDPQCVSAPLDQEAASCGFGAELALLLPLLMWLGWPRRS